MPLSLPFHQLKQASVQRRLRRFSSLLPPGHAFPLTSASNLGKDLFREYLLLAQTPLNHCDAADPGHNPRPDHLVHSAG
jgi:hypothetical protein